MAELLVRIVDRGGVDAAIGYGDSKAGDVISACPDGWPWSAEERTNPMWRIVWVADLTQEEVEALTSLGDGNPSVEACYKRKYGLDLTMLENQFPGIKDANMRDEEMYDGNYQAHGGDTFRDAVVLKA